MIASTEIISGIVENYNKGLPIKRKDNIFYQGMEGTLKANIAFVYTNKEKNEYIKCATDIAYFIETYLGVKLYSFQKDWIKAFENNRYNIIFKSRQVGSSIIHSFIYLHTAIFSSDKNIILISSNTSRSKEFISKIFNAYLKLPYFLKTGIVSRTLSSISFDTGTTIRLANSKDIKDNVSTINIDILYYTEYAFMTSKQLEKYVPLFVEAFNNGCVNIESSPNGLNEFMNLVHNSERKEADPSKNLFVTLRTYWWEIPGRDLEWKEKMIATIGQQSFSQEYDLNFLSRIQL